MSQITHPYDTLAPKALHQRDCAKWQHHPADVLPLWVADMDFPVAEPIKTALQAHVSSDNLGYPPQDGLPGFKEAAIAHLATRYAWQLEPKHLHPLNGIVTGLNLGVLATTSAGDEVLLQSPIYGPFHSAIKDHGRIAVYNPLVQGEEGWEIDFDALETLVSPASRLLMLCNPHNPTGRVFRRDELERLADFALRHRLWVVADELHSDLIYSGHEHIPFASLGAEIGERTLTLFGPTKSFTIAGLKVGFMASSNADLLMRAAAVGGGLVGRPNVLGQAATIAAYCHGGAWLADTLRYLEANRDFVADFIERELPQVKHVPPEGTYLAWLDFGFLEREDVDKILLERARVALNNGHWFGPGGEGYARLNFATSRSIVAEALDRIKTALV